MPPFVYIAAVPRTGSTMLGELLSNLPYAFILQEVNMGSNMFTYKPSGAQQLKAIGVNLPVFKKRHRRMAAFHRQLARFGLHTAYTLKAFKREIFDPLSKNGMQLGVKEIRHFGWRHFRTMFPRLKVVQLGRDPRDIYVSFHHMTTRGANGWQNPLTPEAVAELYRTEFATLMEIEGTCDVLHVRYEDLCMDERILKDVLAFCESPIPDLGELGTFTKFYEKRSIEFDKHGGALSGRSIDRWRTEPDQKIVADAHHFFELLPDFVDYWGYE